jgi:PTEN induced putative kinase 1
VHTVSFSLTSLSALLTDNDSLFAVFSHRSKMKHLPPHPNIVSIQSAFVDVWPGGLPDTHQFPLALPRYLSEDGCGRNQTLFLVMDKYPHTLDVYLRTHTLSTVDKTMIVLQLVEALAHMSAHQISHRYMFN